MPFVTSYSAATGRYLAQRLILLEQLLLLCHERDMLGLQQPVALLVGLHDRQGGRRASVVRWEAAGGGGGGGGSGACTATSLNLHGLTPLPPSGTACQRPSGADTSTQVVAHLRGLLGTDGSGVGLQS